MGIIYGNRNIWVDLFFTLLISASCSLVLSASKNSPQLAIISGICYFLIIPELLIAHFIYHWGTPKVSINKLVRCILFVPLVIVPSITTSLVLYLVISVYTGDMPVYVYILTIITFLVFYSLILDLYVKARAK